MALKSQPRKDVKTAKYSSHIIGIYGIVPA
jgi:hypothetical protein